MAKTISASTSIVILITALTILWGSGVVHPTWFGTEDAVIPQCNDFQGYETQLLSTEPLMMHIKNFISPAESEYLIGIPRKNYTHRLYVNDEDVKAKVAPRLAVLNPQDPVVTCIRRRALKFTGSMGSPDFELFSVNRYSVPHRVQPHTDASATPMLDSDTGRRFNRRTSFFVYVYASDDLEGGETFFPHISVPEKVDLENPAIISRHNASGALGLAAKPVSGSAIFWVGAKPDGTADQETLHEGLPVIKGEKMGMNIWARHYLD